jgi:hypothetical protein
MGNPFGLQRHRLPQRSDILNPMMLGIRNEQIRAFEDAALDTFAARVIAEAESRRDFPWKDQTPAERRQLTIAILRKGLGIGLTTEFDLARFSLLLLRIGTEFETDRKWSHVVEALNDESYDATQRLDRAYAAWRRIQRRVHRVPDE